jgi:hypothetical protein
MRLTTDFELHREDQQTSSIIVQDSDDKGHTLSKKQRQNIFLSLLEVCPEVDTLHKNNDIILEGELAKISGLKYKSYYFVLTKTDLRYYTPRTTFVSESLVLQRSIPLLSMQIR